MKGAVVKGTESFSYFFRFPQRTCTGSKTLVKVTTTQGHLMKAILRGRNIVSVKRKRMNEWEYPVYGLVLVLQWRKFEKV